MKTKLTIIFAFLALFAVFAPPALAQEPPLVPPVPPTTPPPAPSPPSCGGHEHLHDSSEHKALVKKAFDNYKLDKAHIEAHKHMVKCAKTAQDKKQMQKQWNKAQKKWKQKFNWEIQFYAFSESEQQWAHSTSECESGGDPDAVGGGGLYLGALQFSLSTWRSAPHSPGGSPLDYSWYTQAVVAIYLKHRDGTGHWPNCG